jgi:hypothetical protein
MSLKLTDEMREALRDRLEQPVIVEDEQTQQRYVLLPLETYERVQSLFDEDFAVEDAYAAQSAVAGAAGWNDAEMDIYDHCDDQKQDPIYEEARGKMPSTDALMRFVRDSPPISDWDE